jgi:hypothetical protein
MCCASPATSAFEKRRDVPVSQPAARCPSVRWIERNHPREAVAVDLYQSTLWRLGLTMVFGRKGEAAMIKVLKNLALPLLLVLAFSGGEAMAWTWTSGSTSSSATATASGSSAFASASASGSSSSSTSGGTTTTSTAKATSSGGGTTTVQCGSFTSMDSCHCVGTMCFGF